jgi:hypothetical protein
VKEFCFFEVSSFSIARESWLARAKIDKRAKRAFILDRYYGEKNGHHKARVPRELKSFFYP